jgi:Ca2+-binding EF-hand superfamily protein
MLTSLYILLLKMHPAPFRQRFGDEMLGIFQNAGGLGASVVLLADGLISVGRQWVLRPEFRRPLVATVAARVPDVPLFRTIDAYKPRSSALFYGGSLTGIILCAVVVLIGHESNTRAFLIGVHHPSPHLLPVDRASVAVSNLNTTVEIGPAPEDPWHAIASVYFKQIRVLDALDADQDLTISPWEMITAPAALRKLDRNHDGKLSPEECGFFIGDKSNVSIEAVGRARRQFMRMNPVLDALDTDHDGEISSTEILNSSSALKKLDRNGDGRLTPDELIPDEEAIQASIIMMRLDKNGDGSISEAERGSDDAEPLRNLLRSADRNRDGVVTREELIRELRLRAESRKLFENARHIGGFR